MKKLIISITIAGLIIPISQAKPIFHTVEKGETFWSIAQKYYGDGKLGLKLYDRFVENGAGWIYENGGHRHDEWDDTVRPIKLSELQIGTLLFIPEIKNNMRIIDIYENRLKLNKVAK